MRTRHFSRAPAAGSLPTRAGSIDVRSEEHTSELQSQSNLVCRLLLDPATPALYTLSLHDALPISAAFLSALPPRRSPAPPLLKRRGFFMPVPPLMPRLYRNNENTAFQPRAGRWQSSNQGRIDRREIGRAHV